MKRTLKFVYFLVPVLMLFGLIAWRMGQKKKEAAQRDKVAAARKNTLPNVTVVPASIRDVVQTYEAVGSIESPLNVRLASKITGRIDYLQAREGDAVTQGQVLVRVDPSEVAATVAQQESNVAEAQGRLAQAQLTANSTNVGVTSQIAQQRATQASAQADYGQTKANYSAQVGAARASVTDAQGRVATARSAVTNANAMIRSAQANLGNAQARLNRTVDLYKQGFIAAQDVDDARTQVSVQQGALDVARGQLQGAQAAVGSVQAQLKSAQEQASIVATKGTADIEAARQKALQAQAGVQIAVANKSQMPAYLANLRALQAAVAASQAQERNAQAQLANTVLRSPMDGFVTARAADPGTTVTAGTAILTIQSLKQVYVTTSIPEEISRRIKTGQTASADIDALPGRAYTGKITQVNPAADPQSRQFEVRLTLDNPTGQLRPGMFARVTFVTRRVPNALMVPREALRNDKASGGQAVTVVDAQGMAHTRPVKVGVDDGDSLQIVDGLRAGENVVTLSLTPVKDGQKVAAAAAPPADVSGGNDGRKAGRRGGDSSGSPIIGASGSGGSRGGADSGAALNGAGNGSAKGGSGLRVLPDGGRGQRAGSAFSGGAAGQNSSGSGVGSQSGASGGFGALSGGSATSGQNSIGGSTGSAGASGVPGAAK